jgi:hypothetical protein
MFIKHMTLLFFLSSCALFRSQPSLKDQEPEKLLKAVKLTGEGRGRLTLGQSQYVFSVDSVLKENSDWILAVTIPLHGEEVMILPNLKDKESLDDQVESFEERISNEFKRLKLKHISSKEFLAELRSLIRFVLGPSWGQKRVCEMRQKEEICEMDGEKFSLTTTDKEFLVKKDVGEKNNLKLVGKNLTDSFFNQTDIILDSATSKTTSKDKAFSLELFW